MLIDMPLEELKVYQGINPRPHDFDEYWDKALDEMKALDPEVELVPAEFQTPFAECFHLYFTGVGGARVHAKYLRPKNSSKPHRLFDVSWLLRQQRRLVGQVGLCSKRFLRSCPHCRGQGGLSEDVGGVKGNTLHGHIIRGLDDDPEKLLFRSIFLDTAQLARIVMDMPEVDENRVGAMGGSQGGGLTLACASLEPRIKRAAPVFPFLCDYKRVWEMDLAKDAYQEIKDYFRRFDPTHSREDEVFTTLGYIDVQHMTRRIQGEVMMAVGLMDTICPPSTQFAAYNKITSSKRMVIYPDFGHEGLPGFDDMTYEFMMGL